MWKFCTSGLGAGDRLVLLFSCGLLNSRHIGCLACARICSVRWSALRCATPGSAVCDAWVCSVWRLGLQCAMPGSAVCDAWVCSVRRLGLRCATPGSAVCDAWVCAVWCLGLQFAVLWHFLHEAGHRQSSCIRPQCWNYVWEHTRASVQSQAIPSSMAIRIRRHTAGYQHGWPLVLCFLYTSLYYSLSQVEYP